MAGVGIAATAVLAYGLFHLLSGGSGAGPALAPDGGAAGTTASRGGAPALPAAAGPGIEGRVVDGTGAPIAGVGVSALAEETGALGDEDDGGLAAIVAGTATDAGGRFRLAGLAPGHYRVRLEGGGVVAAEVRFVEAPQSGLDLVGSREVAIAGRVVGEGSVAGVAVTALGELGAATAVTDEAGRFRLTGLAEGVYRVWAARGERGSLAARLERFGAGPFKDVELALAPAAIVSGRLIDAESAVPLAGEVVLVHAGDEPPRRARAGDDGRFAIDGVPPGRWFAEASAAGYVPTEQLAFAADRNRELTLQLTRGGTIEGTVLDPDGRPVAGALVETSGGPPDQARRGRAAAAPPSLAFSADFLPRGELGVLLGPIPFPPPAPIANARIAQPLAAWADEGAADSASQRLTDAAGSFRLAGLRPGSYRAIASHPDFSGGRSAEIAVQLGRTVEGVEVRLEAGIRIRGVVRDRRGDPIAAALVTAGAVRTSTGADGAYELPPVATGADIEVAVTAFGFAAASERVTVEDGATPTVDFALEAADQSITGRVFDGAGFALAGARVSAEAGPGAVTGPGGHFEIAGLAAGEHALTVRHPDYPPHRLEAAAGARIEIEVPIGGGIAGEVRDRGSRAPVPGASLEIRRLESRQTWRPTLANGLFELAPLAAGRYRITARARGYAGNAVTVEVPAADRPGDVTARGVVVELDRGANVAGTVRDANGVRVAGAVVKAGVVESLSDIDGHFRLVDVPVGRVVIAATHRGRTGELELNLSPGDDLRTLEISLPPAD
jgi:protocatechuate 3,4-dioxygenase beta subunit